MLLLLRRKFGRGYSACGLRYHFAISICGEWVMKSTHNRDDQWCALSIQVLQNEILYMLAFQQSSVRVLWKDGRCRLPSRHVNCADTTEVSTYIITSLFVIATWRLHASSMPAHSSNQCHYSPVLGVLMPCSASTLHRNSTVLVRSSCEISTKAGQEDSASRKPFETGSSESKQTARNMSCDTWSKCQC